MLWSFAGAKGGVGTSVVAAAVALELARRTEVLIVDLAGDQGDLLGTVDADRAGVWDWLGAEDVEVGAIDRLLVDAADRIRLLPSGTMSASAPSKARVIALTEAMETREGAIVFDLGVMGSDPMAPAALLMTASTRRTVVVRACYLALRRLQRVAVAGFDVVEVREGGRALSTIDIETIVGRPLAARVDVDPGIARVADAGLLTARMPRRLRRMAAELARAAASTEKAAR